jgi:gliding motility-associated-like protein
MRKFLTLLTLLGLFTTQSKAQFPIWFVNTANDGVAFAMSPLNTVKVQRQNPPIPYNNQQFCGVGSTTPPLTPGQYGGYIAGATKSDGFRFTFSNGATRIRIQMADIHDNDSVRILVNGAPYALDALTNLTNSPVCVAPPNTTVVTSTGDLTSVGSPVTPTAVQIDINLFPTMITSFEVKHLRNNPFSGGVIFHAEYWEDTCDAALLVVTDNDPCTGKDLNLSATAYPNATFTWDDGNAPPLWTATGANVTRPNVNITQGGTYNVTVTKGSCPPITGSTFVLLKNGPLPPKIDLNTSPQCKGGTVDLNGYTTGITGVQYFWIGPGGFLNAGTPLQIINIQPNQQGLYGLYAVSTDGCISDTTDTLVIVKPEAKPSFTHSVFLGCTADTIIFYNSSTGDTGLSWYINRVNGPNPAINLVSIDQGPVVTYVMPFDKHDVINAPQTYDLKLYAYNPACYDSQIIQIDINHPLKADFEVDDDTICQNATTINFSNKSSSAVVGTHEYLWDFKDGSPTTDNYNTSHLYSLAGVYDASLIITDYLKCKDTITHKIFVDSTGAITFASSDTVICPGDLVTFKGDFSEIGNIGTVWEFSDGNKHTNVSSTEYAFEAVGTYPVKFTALNRVCPDTTATTNIVVKPQPIVDLGRDTSICPNGAPLVLIDRINAGNPDAKWSWNNNTRSSESKIFVYHPGVYSATVEIDGCSTTDSVKVEKNCYINLPNVFVPGSSENGYFLPRQMLSKGVTKFEMTIFDRWGKKVFETVNIDGRGWDGTFNGEPQPQGVYVYTIEVTFQNKTTEHYQGNVTMLR